ncbi:IS1595 family transposase [Novosphingobium sp. CECT 9465]|uniref:IS1595 family transposase n=1 Tax=Novosphingobium sp. CECT 9465 TaxID=2829794 RepID=UPI001E561F81|nr:IS1595 family transposase [Novosphingobium sp. CECT 9465]CAH0497167.1 IS1595 family transposase ISSpo3 [Novosphingobium sp. CECT 9465]CAH0497170.1 IS1595 family transposase ISSpo3 [Novosphingobium sp. CECT 9465]
MSKPQTILQFFKQFPDDEACLTHLFEVRFGQGYACPSCERPSKWFRIKAERAYSCQWCGHHLHPTVGTPFEQTRTPLQLWFYAIYLFTTTRNGVAAKELQRQLGVTYKTAWRMACLIREHMADVDGDNLLGGPGEHVEVDETLIGGSVSGKGSGYKGNKTAVVGVMERGGEIVTRVVQRRTKQAMRAVILDTVMPGTTLNTDEFGGYKDIDQSGYRHIKVNHNAGQYVCTTSGATVNALEGFWAQLKRSINGTHVHVSGKHLWKYAKEAEYRFNRRETPSLMLPELLSTFGPLKPERD